jgi:hypothetical protein
VPTPVNLRERLQAGITAAMRSGDALRRDTLRMAENAIYNAEKRERRTYSDEEVVAVLGREVKTRRESIEAFRKGGREDLAAKEAAEIEILAEFLPEPTTSCGPSSTRRSARPAHPGRVISARSWAGSHREREAGPTAGGSASS